MSIILILIIIAIICMFLIIRPSYNSGFNNIENTLPLYLDKPTKLFELYFPYIDIIYINNKIILKSINIDVLIQTIPDYETKIFNILTDKKYDNIYKAIFDMKPEYNLLYNIFYAYMLNRINSILIKETDVQNKYIINKLFNDIDNLYLIPFTESIDNINNLPTITDYNMIDTICKKNNKYIPCKIKITPAPKNFQIIEDKYYQDIVDYYTSMIFVDILKLIPLNQQCNVIIPMEEERQKKFRERLKTTFIDILPPIETTISKVTTCSCQNN